MSKSSNAADMKEQAAQVEASMEAAQNDFAAVQAQLASFALSYGGVSKQIQDLKVGVASGKAPITMNDITELVAQAEALDATAAEILAQPAA